VVEQKKLTKGRAALLLILSALGAIASATMLHGWHVIWGSPLLELVFSLGSSSGNREY